MGISIDVSGGTPIYLQIVEQMVGKLSSGALRPGDKIPSVRELSASLAVNPNTVARAYRDLQHMNIISSRRGEGSFISEKVPALPAVGSPACGNALRRAADLGSGSARPAIKTFAILAISSEGHMYEPLHTHLVSRLRARGIVPVSAHVDVDTEKTRRGIDELMHLKPAAIIMEGGLGEKIMGHLESKAGSFGAALFLINKPSEISGKFRSHSVTTDYWLGAYAATKHLLGLGHRMIMLMMLKIDRPMKQFRLLGRSRFLDGYRAALREAGLQDSESYFYDEYDVEESLRSFRKFLKKKEMPTAIVSTEDFRITTKLECLREAGISIPRDISAVGYYNTPWCTATEVQLSSVSIREDLVAEKAAQIISGEEKSGEIMIPPELVERGSCRNISHRRREK